MRSEDVVRHFLATREDAVLSDAQSARTKALRHGSKATILNGVAGVLVALTEFYEAGVLPRSELAATVRKLARIEKHPFAFRIPNMELPRNFERGFACGTVGVAYAKVRAAIALDDDVHGACAAYVKVARKLLETAPDFGELWGGSAAILAATEALQEPRLDALVREARASLLSRLAVPFARRDRGLALGMAHGVAGELYAICASRDPIPDLVHARLGELASLAVREDSLISWPARVGEAVDGRCSRFCAGTPGILYLFATAYARSGVRRYATLAKLAAETTLQMGAESGSICCGYAGHAVALAHYADVVGDARMARHARARLQRAHRAVAAHDTLPSLFHGEVGTALLALRVWQRRALTLPCFAPARDVTHADPRPRGHSAARVTM